MPANARVDELTTDEVVALYRDAAAAGFQVVVIWGGEPLLRLDTGIVLRAAKEAGLATTLITNGWWLESRVDEVAPWLDRLMVSVDAIGTRHDEIRRLPGLFDRLEHGLARVRQVYPKVDIIVNGVLSRLNADQIEAIAEFGKRYGTQVTFQGMDVSDYGYSQRSLHLPLVQLTPEEEEKVAARVARLRRQGYPIRDSNSYLARLGLAVGKYRCHFKKVCLRVEPNGDVLDCTEIGLALANVREVALRDLVRRRRFRDFQRRAEACNRCRDAAPIEISHIWEGRIEAIWNAVRSLA
jgi:MoaA/NifB/PqqE/SkfB family radical SAM enzyme